MATVDKQYVLDGTRLTRSYIHRERNQAVVIVYLSNVTNDESGKNEAINAAVASVGSTFTHGSETLPLDVAHADIWALGKARVRLVYRRTSATDPARAAFDTCDEVGFSFRWRTKWWIWDTSSNTLTAAPLDTVYTLGSSERLWGERYRSPISRVSVDTVLDSNPVSTVGTLYRKINSDAVVIGGVTRAPYTLRFWNPQVNAIDTPDGVRWPTQYVYEYAQDTFTEYELDIDGSDVLIKTIPPQSENLAAFAGQFPTHDAGNGPQAA